MLSANCGRLPSEQVVEYCKKASAPRQVGFGRVRKLPCLSRRRSSRREGVQKGHALRLDGLELKESTARGLSAGWSACWAGTSFRQRTR